MTTTHKFPSLVLGGRDEDRLGGGEGQRADAVKVGAQRVLGRPGFAEGLLKIGAGWG